MAWNDRYTPENIEQMKGAFVAQSIIMQGIILNFARVVWGSDTAQALTFVAEIQNRVAQMAIDRFADQLPEMSEDFQRGLKVGEAAVFQGMFKERPDI